MAEEKVTQQQERSDLDWSPEELAAMDGSADAEANAEESVLSPKAESADGAQAASGEEVPGGEGQGDAGDDPSQFIDTRQRKESYTPEEYSKLVRQRDFFQNQTRRLEQQIETGNERLTKIEEVLTQKEAIPPPDRSEDPAGYLDHRLEGVDQKVEKVVSSLEEERRMREAARQQQQFEQAGEQATQAHIQETGQTREQYLAKVQALRQARFEDFVDEGFDEDRAWGMLVGWENQVIRSAFSRNENPATVMERMWKRRGLPAAEVRTPGETASPAATTPEGPSTQEVIKRAQEGVKQQRSQEAVPRGKSFKLTYDLLSKMNAEEFNEVMDKIQGTSMEEELDSLGSTRVVL